MRKWGNVLLILLFFVSSGCVKSDNEGGSSYPNYEEMKATAEDLEGVKAPPSNYILEAVAGGKKAKYSLLSTSWKNSQSYEDFSRKNFGYYEVKEKNIGIIPRPYKYRYTEYNEGWCDFKTYHLTKITEGDVIKRVYSSGHSKIIAYATVHANRVPARNPPASDPMTETISMVLDGNEWKLSMPSDMITCASSNLEDFEGVEGSKSTIEVLGLKCEDIANKFNFYLNFNDLYSETFAEYYSLLRKEDLKESDFANLTLKFKELEKIRREDGFTGGYANYQVTCYTDTGSGHGTNLDYIFDDIYESIDLAKEYAKYGDISNSKDALRKIRESDNMPCLYLDERRMRAAAKCSIYRKDCYRISEYGLLELDVPLMKIENSELVKLIYDSRVANPGFFFHIEGENLSEGLLTFIDEGNFGPMEDDYGRKISEFLIIPPDGILEERKNESHRGIEIYYYTYKVGNEMWYILTYEHCGRAIGFVKEEVWDDGDVKEIKSQIGYFIYGNQ